MKYDRAFLCIVGGIALLFAAGCSSEASKEASSSGKGEVAATSPSETKPITVPEGKKHDRPVLPADLPATLAELDANVEWIDQPVKDGMTMRREKQTQERPLASVAEALASRNTSRDSNDKILSVLGRVETDESQVDYDAVITRHFLRDVKSTNPIMYSTLEENMLGLMMTYTLITADWNLDPFAPAEVVASWQTSKDRLVDKFVLRDDLTWSDGKPLTAHDFVFTFQTIMNPKVPVPAVRTSMDKLKWIHAYDDRTLVIFHKEALATNVWNVELRVIPRHIYETSIEEDPKLDGAYHVQYEDLPVTPGPYVITKRTRGQEFILKRREGWYMHNGKQVRAKPYFREIRVQIISDPNTALLALRNGDLDEMVLTPEQWATQTNDDSFYRFNTKAYGLEWSYFLFGWNLKTPYFSDLRVRQAMAYAVDYKELLDKLTYGLYQQSNGMFHPTAWVAPKVPPPFYRQDLDKAEDLLDEAGWKDHDGDGIRDKMIDGRLVPFEFSIIVTPIPERVKVCALLSENLSRIGITCHVSQLETTLWLDKTTKHDFQAVFGGWITAGDPDSSENIYSTGEGRNFGYYSNPEVDRLYLAGRRELDRAKRAEIYGRIHTLIYADQPVTFLYFRSSFFAFNKQLRGYMFSPRTPYGYSPGFHSFHKVKN